MSSACYRTIYYFTELTAVMRIIVSLALIALLGCTSAMPSATASGEWPGKTVYVECINEPGMESRIFSAVATLHIRGMKLLNTGYRLQMEFSIAITGKYDIREMEQRLREIPGILN